MNLDYDQLYTDLRSQTNVGDTESSKRGFVRALTATLGVVNPKWGTSYAAPQDAPPFGTQEIEDYEYTAFWTGCRHHLQQHGDWALESDSESMAKFESAWRSAIAARVATDTSFKTGNQVDD